MHKRKRDLGTEVGPGETGVVGGCRGLWGWEFWGLRGLGELWVSGGSEEGCGGLWVGCLGGLGPVSMPRPARCHTHSFLVKAYLLMVSTTSRKRILEVRV